MKKSQKKIPAEKFCLDRELRKLYNRENSFNVQRGLDRECFFNLLEFAEYHDIDGQSYLSVLTTDTRAQTFSLSPFSQDSVTGLSKSKAKLFLSCEDVETVHAEQPLRIDGRLYQITNAVKIGNVIWELDLSANVS